jgi:hypothetical protein
MKYLYKINSLYDGFTPQKIEERMEKGTFLTFNWREYFDEVEPGDVVFTYFIGSGVKKGVYLICKVSKIMDNRKVLGRVLRYDQKEPLISPTEFAEYENAIITRPIGSVYVIPSLLDIAFEDLRKKVTISEIEVGEVANCYRCETKNCSECSLLKPNFLIKWENEVALKISLMEQVISPFWIIPRQSHWMKKTISEHPISRIWYDFKSGYTAYAKLFAFGILKAMENDPRFNAQFDFVLGVPLSPEKKRNNELDRVSELCEILSSETKIPYLPEGLSLTANVTKGEYRRLGKTTFGPDYYAALKLEFPTSLNDKTVLLIDDVVTDGTTFRIISRKIKDSYPDCHIFGAAAGIMAKVGNMSQNAFDKFRQK